jgi:hypothetical protein
MTATVELVFTHPKDPECAAEMTPIATASPNRKLPAMPYTGRKESVASRMNPTCGEVSEVCAHAIPAAIDNVASIVLITDAPR